MQLSLHSEIFIQSFFLTDGRRQIAHIVQLEVGCPFRDPYSRS